MPAYATKMTRIAKADMSDRMELMEEVRSLAASGKGPQAIRLVEHAAARGNADAALILGNWRAYGIYGPRDIPQALALFRASAAGGQPEAARLTACLIANGLDGPPDFARGLSLMQHLAGDDAVAAVQVERAVLLEREPPAARRLRASPQISLFPAAFTAEECAYVIAAAAPRVRPSLVLDPRTNRAVRDPVRKSGSAAFDPLSEDLAIRAINRHVARLADLPVAHGEQLHVLRYAAGDEYRLHLDALRGTANQRVRTAIIYLNDDYDGGETVFPRLDLIVKGRTGDCLVFDNVDATDRPDRDAVHAGRPVAQGVKWIATRWIRRHPIDPFDANAPLVLQNSNTKLPESDPQGLT